MDKNYQNKILRVTDGQVNGRSNDMNTVLIVQLEDLDDNPPEFEFEEKTRDPRSGFTCAKFFMIKLRIPCHSISMCMGFIT